MELLGRTHELAALEDNWTAHDARLYVLWGRRRVGKTELLSHFIQGRRALYFEATDAARQDQLGDLSHEIARVSGKDLLQPLTSWEAALAAIEQYAASERTIVVLDEFQHLAAQDRELGSLLNRWWRTAGCRLPLVLVLAGSDVSFFERRVLGDELYGPPTGQRQLTPFDHRSAALFVPRYSVPDKIRTYAVCGGMPYYLERFDDRVPLAENILRHILRRDGFLHEEAELLLRQQLSDPHNHFSTLRAIAAGRTRNSEIMDWTGLDSARVRQITSVLERLALVQQRRPATAGPRARKTTYAILDGFLRFHFRFVEPYRSLLRTRAGAERHLRRTVLPQLDHFVSKPAFEEICRSHLHAAERAAAVGAWWGAVPSGYERRTERCQLDAVALNDRRAVVAVGSCNWTAEQVGLAEEALLTRLQGHAAGLYADRSRIRHYFYARSGFEDSLRRLSRADPEHYKLIDPEDLYD
ncbi:MAG TPA: ATP-binding protein [Solirubrobacteraceae bacterium]|jgi:hypothetical protein